VNIWQLEELQPPLLLPYVRSLLPPQAYQGSTWLPDRLHGDVEYQYVIGARNTPVMAHIIGWDSEAPIAGREAVGQKVFGELPPIKRKRRISEKEILRFMTPRLGTADQQDALRQLMGSISNLVASIQARVEWLRMQALSEDVVVYDEGGVNVQFNFGLTDAYQIDLVTQTDGSGASVAADYGPAWSDTANATPVTDLMHLCDKIQDENGQRPATLLCSRKYAGYLIDNDQAKGWIYPTNAPDRPLLPGEVQGLFSRYDLPTIRTYDVTVQTEAHDGTTSTVRPMRQNAAVLLPPSPVGNTLWGPTAESRALIGTPYQQMATGLWASTYGTDEPPGEWSKVVAVAFPTLPDAHLLGQMTLGA
jgi:Phage major capsid protein E